MKSNERGGGVVHEWERRCDGRCGLCEWERRGGGVVSVSVTGGEEVWSL